MADDPFVFFVEGVHGRPCERDSCLQFAGVSGQFNMLPRSSRRAVVTHANGVPGSEAEVVMTTRMLGAFQMFGDMSFSGEYATG